MGVRGARLEADSVSARELAWVLHPGTHSAEHGLHVQGLQHWGADGRAQTGRGVVGYTGLTTEQSVLGAAGGEGCRRGGATYRPIV